MPKYRLFQNVKGKDYKLADFDNLEQAEEVALNVKKLRGDAINLKIVLIETKISTIKQQNDSIDTISPKKAKQSTQSKETTKKQGENNGKQKRTTNKRTKSKNSTSK